jgi:hypothetical protein
MVIHHQSNIEGFRPQPNHYLVVTFYYCLNARITFASLPYFSDCQNLSFSTLPIPFEIKDVKANTFYCHHFNNFFYNQTITPRFQLLLPLKLAQIL